MTDATTGKTIEQAFDAALERYADRPGITGIDIGYKYVGKERTDAVAIRLHVNTKMPTGKLSSDELFPQEFEGFPVDVIQGSYGIDAPDDPGEPANAGLDPSARFPVLRPGISTGRVNMQGGTLGMFVKDRRSGNPAILSNWHVLAGSSSASVGDIIIQPNLRDGGLGQQDAVARLERMFLNQDGDAAIALLTGARPIDPTPLDLNVVPSAVADPQIGDVVVKSGRSTRVTRGRVDGKGRYRIRYSVGTVWIDGFIIVPRIPQNPANEEISTGGDSGSVWIKEGTQTVVGLHFAGETDPRPAKEHALACFATRVFARLDIDPWTAP